ncbi:MAG: ribulose-phosphate 3-epimerase [Lachnospiraceae bacterium]|nr:ribulose-phosphate 3-epimerase [Lachnospiraceae bacterium]
MKKKRSKEYQLSPSIISADYNCLEKQFSIMKEENVKYLHLDIMDGEYVPSICMDIPLIKSIRQKNTFVFDAHIMTTNVRKMIEELLNIDIDIISIHLEIEESPYELIKEIKHSGKKAGIVLNPETSVKKIPEKILQLVNTVQIMSVAPGVGGQSFIRSSVEKIKQLYSIRKKMNLEFDIEVDGDVNLQNLPWILEAGANIIVSGTTLFKDDFRENIQEFYKVINDFKNNGGE